MSIRRVALIAVASVAVLGALLLVAPDARRAPAPAEAQSGSSTLAWRACGAPFECTTLRVPLDYARPTDRQIEVALVRQPARDPERREGALLVNPGGPGASGIEFTRAIAGSFAADIRDRFDIVGFDPRGVGESTPLVCHDSIQRLAGLDPVPATDDDWAEAAQLAREFAALCAQRGGDLLPHLGSVDVVHDMDRIREALGDQQLSYLGYSYGTLLGLLYADRYPDRVRAFVLDGAIDPAIGADEGMAAQAVGFERAIDGFNANCRARSCPLAADGRDPWAAVIELVDRARTRPIPSAAADRAAGPGEVFTGAMQALYRPGSWRALERAVTEARGGDGSTFVRLTDAYLGREGNDYANQSEMNAAVNCLDYEYARDPAHYRALQPTLAAVAPRIGPSMAPMGLLCAYWPAPAQPLRLAGGAPSPTLIIGTTNDPATPYEWAIGAHRALPNSVLLTHEGDGHTVYLTGNRCVDAVVNAYLLALTTPQDGAICARGATGAPTAPPTPPARAVATPVLAAPEARAAAAVTSTAAPTVSTETSSSPPPTEAAPSPSIEERTRESAIGLRLLAVTVLALVIAVIVVTRRRLMRP
ncbi:MAG: alpha/beta hydrolase [Dehalococcoidia bacterium]